MAVEGAAGGSTNESIAAMNKAAEDNQRLMVASTQVSTQIQGAASTAHTIEGANAAGGEVAKATGNDMRSAAKAS
jgi:hypothetical protein